MNSCETDIELGRLNSEHHSEDCRHSLNRIGMCQSPVMKERRVSRGRRALFRVRAIVGRVEQVVLIADLVQNND